MIHLPKTLITFVSVIFLLLTVSCGDDVVPDPDEIAPEDKLIQIIVSTLGNTIVDEPKVAAIMLISSVEDTLWQGRIGIEYRGASSQALFPKKSLGLELWDENDEGIDAALLGMPEEEDWILHGPYSDKTLMRNKLIYDLSREIGQYASRCELVELTINNEERGTYVFMEKLKRDKNRIDINKLKEDENTGEDLTGGYILKIDKTAGNNLGEGYNELNSFSSTYSPPSANSNQLIHFLYEYPDAEDITGAQKEYISQYLASFEDALASSDFTDIEEGYRKYIDVPSFIDFFILNEISNNVDGYRLSTYMHKEKNEKLKMGPIWDFNLAFGNADYCAGGESNVWAYQFNERCSEDFWLVPFWWNRMMEDPQFVSELKSRWTELRMGSLSNLSVQDRLQSDINKLNNGGAIDKNNNIWGAIGMYIWPNNFVGDSYQADLSYMQTWISDRLIWLDGAIEAL